MQTLNSRREIKDFQRTVKTLFENQWRNNDFFILRKSNGRSVIVKNHKGKYLGTMLNSKAIALTKQLPNKKAYIISFEKYQHEHNKRYKARKNVIPSVRRIHPNIEIQEEDSYENNTNTYKVKKKGGFRKWFEIYSALNIISHIWAIKSGYYDRFDDSEEVYEDE